MPNRELTPEEEEQFARLEARMTRLDPTTSATLKRAVELARRNDQTTVTVKEILEALLYTTVTPALIQHLHSARAISQDEGDVREYLDDLAVLAGMLSDGTSLVYQILERHVDDMDALIRDVRRNVRDIADSG